MKRLPIFFIYFLLFDSAHAQHDHTVQQSTELEQQLENLTELQSGEPEDDTHSQSLAYYRKHKIDLNDATEADLKEIRFVTDLQIQQLLNYKRLLGNLVSIYELQSVPGWDIATILRVLPYVSISSTASSPGNLKQRLSAGEHAVLIRLQQVIEKSNGFTRADSIDNRYMGSSLKTFLRYRYQFRNLFQFGITGEKDAGEQFFKGNQKQGFDFYSFHLFARKSGFVKLLAVGDFTVNLGQGLIHWQSLAFKKSADITTVKRQAEILKPYNSSGEYNFMRGAGISIGTGKVTLTAFASTRKIDGSYQTDTSQTTDDYISSILNSGYHRTPSEITRKNSTTQNSFGGNIAYTNKSLHIGVNGIAFKFSVPLIRNVTPYSQFAIQGKEWSNYSVDYSYTYRNFHFFGEAAVDQKNATALLGGMLASLDEKVEVSVLFRKIEKSYQTLYGNAFTESVFPTNETGVFTGITLRPASFLKIDAYADVFSFPWLKYRVDAPSRGTEYLLQFSYKPDKMVEVYCRFKSENKAINLSGANLAFRQVLVRPKESLRIHTNFNVNRQLTFNQRVEILWFDKKQKERRQQGFLAYVGSKYKLPSKAMALNGRLQYFETGGFDSRLYAFENDLLFSYSIPQFIGKGFRYYVNVNCDINKKMTVWGRWSQTIFSDQDSISSGLDRIKGNIKSEIKFQLLYTF